MFSRCFFFNDTATTETYTYGHTLSRHDALPICWRRIRARRQTRWRSGTISSCHALLYGGVGRRTPGESHRAVSNLRPCQGICATVVKGVPYSLTARQRRVGARIHEAIGDQLAKRIGAVADGVLHRGIHLAERVRVAVGDEDRVVTETAIAA